MERFFTYWGDYVLNCYTGVCEPLVCFESHDYSISISAQDTFCVVCSLFKCTDLCQCSAAASVPVDLAVWFSAVLRQPCQEVLFVIACHLERNCVCSELTQKEKNISSDCCITACSLIPLWHRLLMSIHYRRHYSQLQPKCRAQVESYFHFV